MPCPFTCIFSQYLFFLKLIISPSLTLKMSILLFCWCTVDSVNYDIYSILTCNLKVRFRCQRKGIFWKGLLTTVANGFKTLKCIFSLDWFHQWIQLTLSKGQHLSWIFCIFHSIWEPWICSTNSRYSVCILHKNENKRRTINSIIFSL